MTSNETFIDREKLPYRDGVNVFVVNEKGEFLIVQKLKYSTSQWDVAGGGTDGEAFDIAMYRELEEELGLTKDMVEVLGAADELYVFDWPDADIISTGKKYRGQAKTYTDTVKEFKQKGWL